MKRPVTFVVMGPAGCGKSTLASDMAAALGRPFIEGDTLHRPGSIAKMSRGISLTDDDRWPWLDRVADVIVQHADGGCVVSCSALKRIYRDRLRTQAGTPIAFVFPDVPRNILESRLARRASHFMPATLLDSQLATLEIPGVDEFACRLDGSLGRTALTAAALRFAARSA